MAGISSPAAFKRVNSVTFFSGHTVEQGCPFSLAANVFLHRDQQKMLTVHHSVNNSPTTVSFVLYIFYLYTDLIKLQQLNIVLLNKIKINFINNGLLSAESFRPTSSITLTDHVMHFKTQGIHHNPVWKQPYSCPNKDSAQLKTVNRLQEWCVCGWNHVVELGESRDFVAGCPFNLKQRR